jgi:lipoprotein-anchoring transpeptidase ErfK/SrfK
LKTRRIEVNLSTQSLTAYEDEIPVFEAPVATGRDGFNTPAGSFAIYDRYPLQTMYGALGGESWYVPDVPWVQYIVGGVALHGTYWHDQWGTGSRMSHGCINLNIDDAQWLYGWAGIGTQVNVFY